MEHFSKTNKQESLPTTPFEELEMVTENLSARVARLEREGSTVDISEETSERISKKIDKIKNILKVASMGLALYGGVKVADEVNDYATSRYEITKKTGADYKVEYEHEDPEKVLRTYSTPGTHYVKCKEPWFEHVRLLGQISCDPRRRR